MPQRALLFSGTIQSNLQVGKPDASETEMNHAIRIAQATDFVLEEPEGLTREIAQGAAMYPVVKNNACPSRGQL